MVTVMVYISLGGQTSELQSQFQLITARPRAVYGGCTRGDRKNLVFSNCHQRHNMVSLLVNNGQCVGQRWSEMVSVDRK